MKRRMREYDMVLTIVEKVVSVLKKSALVPAVCCLLLLPACSAQDQPAHSHHEASATAVATVPTLVFQEQAIPLQVELEPAAAQILKENQLRIIVPAAYADQLKQAAVSVALTMPDMDHGAVTFPAEKSEAGHYVARVIPTMVGNWVATITFEVDGESVSATYAFEAVP